MSFEARDPFASVIAKLGHLSPLNDADRVAIRGLNVRVTSACARTLLIEEGGPTTECCFLLDGYACRSKTTKAGGRQIVSFHMAGDFLDLQHLLLPVADHNVETMTKAVVGWVAATDLRRLAQQRPAVSEALWRDTLIDASIFREWVLNVGRRGAKSRIAHLLCEFAARHEKADLGSHERFALPMTQEQIADATGLTSVHVNRMLREMTLDELIARDGRELQIRNWGRLCRLADFEVTYLHAVA